MDSFLPSSSFDPQALFQLGLHLDEKHFPKHIIFGNFQCLRCGLCCKNWEGAQIRRLQALEWKEMGRNDILKHIRIPKYGDAEAVPKSYNLTCPFSRKVSKQPYYSCKIYNWRDGLPICKVYLCRKSLPIAHINYESIDDLIQIIGLKEYYALIERNWNEAFDFDDQPNKTHRRANSN